ncbi:MAG: RnfABCDGE type electron transport complex subunit D [Acidobacteria bacterium]|nr:RnfABCDGE type electron transport complex subunit D [Acidobacteriota bacterium]
MPEEITETPQIKNRLELTTSPHLHNNWSTPRAMWMVGAALLPCTAAALVFFGWTQIFILLTSILCAVGTEALIQKLRKQPGTAGDGSAVLTGWLLALTLPPGFSLVSTGIGAVVAVGIGKHIFGGLGYNIFNPALVGRAFLQAAFPVAMTTWESPNFVDTVTSATPLGALKFDAVTSSLAPMFFGNTGGSLGETSALALLAGGIFLIAIGIVNWRIPAAMTIGALVFGTPVWLMNVQQYPSPVYHLLGGGFLLGALFMATDWVSSPVTNRGMWIFGLGISLIVVVIRVFGGLPEGMMYAILIMNAFVPMIDRFTRPRVFGAVA